MNKSRKRKHSKRKGKRKQRGGFGFMLAQMKFLDNFFKTISNPLVQQTGKHLESKIKQAVRTVSDVVKKNKKTFGKTPFAVN